MKTILKTLLALFSIIWATIATVTVANAQSNVEFGRYHNNQFVPQKDMPTFASTSDFGQRLEQAIQNAWKNFTTTTITYVDEYACIEFENSLYVVGKIYNPPTNFRSSVDFLETPVIVNSVVQKDSILATRATDIEYAKSLSDSIVKSTLDSLNKIDSVKTEIKQLSIIDNSYKIIVPCEQDKQLLLKQTKNNFIFDNSFVTIIVNSNAMFVDVQTQLDLQYLAKKNVENRNKYLDSLDYLVNIQETEFIPNGSDQPVIVSDKKVSVKFKRYNEKKGRLVRKEHALRRAIYFFDKNSEETLIVKATNGILLGDGILSPNGDERCGGDMSVKRQIINNVITGTLTAGVLPALHFGQKFLFKGIVGGLKLVYNSVRNKRLKDKEQIAQK